MIEAFTPKRIYPDCPFTGNQRQVRILILFPWCAVWLCSLMHSAELDWVPIEWYLCTMESDSAVWCSRHCGIWPLWKYMFSCFHICYVFQIIFIKNYSWSFSMIYWISWKIHTDTLEYGFCSWSVEYVPRIFSKWARCERLQENIFRIKTHQLSQSAPSF